MQKICIKVDKRFVQHVCDFKVDVYKTSEHGKISLHFTKFSNTDEVK